MKLRLETSGGFANLRLGGELDVAELSPELSARFERTCAPRKLTAAAVGDPHMADGQVYELTLLPETEDGELQRFLIDDACAEAETLDVLDELMHEIVRRKAAARTAGDREPGSSSTDVEATEAPPPTDP